MPPRHGQSQLISPVSSLKAPCCAASSSRSSGEPPSDASSGTADVAATAWASEVGFAEIGEGSDEVDADDWRALRAAAMASTVGKFSSSISAIGRRAEESIDCACISSCFRDMLRLSKAQ